MYFLNQVFKDYDFWRREQILNLTTTYNFCLVSLIQIMLFGHNGAL